MANSYRYLACITVIKTCIWEVKGENSMQKLIKWCEENGFQLRINPNDFGGNAITFTFIHYRDVAVPDFRIAHSIDKIELYESRVSEDVLVMELIKHIENEWVNYKKAKGDVIWSYSLQ